MASEPNEGKPLEPKGPVPDFEEAPSNLSNAELLSARDLALLELEKRLYRYAHVGPEVLEMAVEGLALAARGGARLGHRPSLLPSTLRTTCGWWGWASGDPPTRAFRGTPSLVSLRRSRTTPRNRPLARMHPATALFTNFA
jgi:hypothetical protein